jgi:hypothetical protein
MLLGSPALAEGRVEGTLTTTRQGKPTPTRYSLVFLRGFSSKVPAAPVRSVQKGRAFQPPVLAVVKGQPVEFANDEPEGYWHHVFSSAPANAFDLGRYKAPERRRQVLYKEGRVDVFCDIHKEMFATLWVVPNTSFAVLPDAASGTTDFALDHVPAGAVTLVAWNRSGTAPVEVPVRVADGKTTRVDVTLELGERPLDVLLSGHLDARGRAYTDENRKQELGGW